MKIRLRQPHFMNLEWRVLHKLREKWRDEGLSPCQQRIGGNSTIKWQWLPTGADSYRMQMVTFIDWLSIIHLPPLHFLWIIICRMDRTFPTLQLFPILSLQNIIGLIKHRCCCCFVVIRRKRNEYSAVGLGSISEHTLKPEGSSSSLVNLAKDSNCVGRIFHLREMRGASLNSHHSQGQVAKVSFRFSSPTRSRS